MKPKKLSVLFLLLIAAQFVFAQNMISGNVIRENKKPLTGVKVTIEGVKGTEATTDQLGNFDIEVPLTAKILIFSYEGMKTQKIGIGKKSFISVTMIEGKDEVPPPPVKKEEKAKDTAKVKSKDVQDTASKKSKEVKPKDSSKDKSKDNNKDKSKDNNKDKSKENSKEKTKSKDSKSTEAKDVENEISQPASTEEQEPAKTTTDTKKSKKSK